MDLDEENEGKWGGEEREGEKERERGRGGERGGGGGEGWSMRAYEYVWHSLDGVIDGVFF